MYNGSIRRIRKPSPKSPAAKYGFNVVNKSNKHCSKSLVVEFLEQGTILEAI